MHSIFQGIGMRTSVTLLLILVFLLLNPILQKQASSASSSTGSNAKSVTQLWSFTTDGSVYTSPIIANGCIYALSSFEREGNAGNIYCINASTGTQIWNYAVEGYVYSALAVSGGYVYTGSSRPKFIALNASTGAEEWTFTDGSFSTPTVSEGIVYVNGLYALNALTGAKIWSGPGSWLGVPPTVSGDRVYLCSLYNGIVYALDAGTGAQIWSSAIDNYTVHSPPFVVGGHVYAVPDNGNVYCLDARTGARIWNYSTGRSGNFESGKVWTPSIIGGFVGFPVAVGGYTYVGSDNGVLHAINDSTGIEIWNYTTDGVVGSPSVANGYLYLGSNSGNNGNFYVLNASTGARVWNYTTENISGPPTLTGPTETTAAPPVVSGSVVYFASGRTVEAWGDIRGVNGTVHAFDALTGAQIWNYTIKHPMGYILVGSDMIYAVSAGGFGKNLDHPISSTIYALKPVTSSPLPSTLVVIVVVVIVVILLVGVGLLYFKKRKH
jgi:outer membrane protein assembly factor BamB